MRTSVRSVLPFAIVPLDCEVVKPVLSWNNENNVKPFFLYVEFVLVRSFHFVFSPDLKPLNTSPHPLNSHSSPCRPHLVTVPELLLLFALGRGVVGRDLDGRKGQDIEVLDAEVWERGSGAEGIMCDADGEEGREEPVTCLHEGWKREKKPGESGIEGEDAAVEVGEVQVEVEVKVGREMERVMSAASNGPWT